MSVTLTSKEVDLLKQLAAAGERGRTISAPTPRDDMVRLVRAGYASERAVSRDTVLYVITNRGREALASAKPSPE